MISTSSPLGLRPRPFLPPSKPLPRFLIEALYLRIPTSNWKGTLFSLRTNVLGPKTQLYLSNRFSFYRLQFKRKLWTKFYWNPFCVMWDTQVRGFWQVGTYRDSISLSSNNRLIVVIWRKKQINKHSTWAQTLKVTISTDTLPFT